MIFCADGSDDRLCAGFRRQRLEAAEQSLHNPSLPVVGVKH
jgi:hypothetical protein